MRLHYGEVILVLIKKENFFFSFYIRSGLQLTTFNDNEFLTSLANLRKQILIFDFLLHTRKNSLTVDKDDAYHGDPEEYFDPVAGVHHGQHNSDDEEHNLYQNTGHDARREASPAKWKAW